MRINECPHCHIDRTVLLQMLAEPMGLNKGWAENVLGNCVECSKYIVPAEETGYATT